MVLEAARVHGNLQAKTPKIQSKKRVHSSGLTVKLLQQLEEEFLLFCLGARNEWQPTDRQSC
jgi:hypothetical protein